MRSAAGSSGLSADDEFAATKLVPSTLLKQHAAARRGNDRQRDPATIRVAVAVSGQIPLSG
ncbi:MAG: hypothetical protein ACE37B_15120 [Ilumatobacter sp.]|uniref:hypothetical protein n=1 Tax=Ilumatobacter sp. TaxID=1967498 RepID=UPI003918AD18